jgi:hypothetical protein
VVQGGWSPTGGPVRSDSGSNNPLLPVMERVPIGTSDSGRTLFCPVGTDRPARQRPIALVRRRPVTPFPFYRVDLLYFT